MMLFLFVFFVVTGNGQLTVLGSSSLEDFPENDDFPDIESSNLQNHIVASSMLSNSAEDSVEKAVAYLLNMQDSDYGWGTFTPRAVVALSLASKVSPIAEKNKQLVLKRLNIHILQDLMKHKNNTLSTLAHYINALIATCQDPRNFQGMDLVARLRTELDCALKSNTNTPFVYLTLCLANATVLNDYYKLAKMYNSKDFKMRTGSKALIILAMTCISRKKEIFGSYVSHFFDKQMTGNIQFTDIYNQALFMQASIANGVRYPIEIASKQLPDGSFGDMLSTYYAIPVLINTSLLDLVCNTPIQRSSLEGDLYRHVGSKEAVYSLWIASGEDPISHSITIKFDEGDSLLDIMKKAASIDDLYRFLYEESSSGKKVYSMAGIPNDIESETYWFLYRSCSDNIKINSEQGLQLLDLSLDKITPADKDHLIFWLRNLPEDFLGQTASA